MLNEANIIRNELRREALQSKPDQAKVDELIVRLLEHWGYHDIAESIRKIKDVKR